MDMAGDSHNWATFAYTMPEISARTVHESGRRAFARPFLHRTKMFDLISTNSMITTMDKAMTVASRRMALVGSNIANIDTPYYRAKDLPFEETLQAALKGFTRHDLQMARTHPMHLSEPGAGSQPYSIDQAITQYERNDFNDVNLDDEMLKSTQTTSAYLQANAFAQTAIKRIFHAIREGAK
jgi:flagellar basal-body rod protein FlgB